MIFFFFSFFLSFFALSFKCGNVSVFYTISDSSIRNKAIQKKIGIKDEEKKEVEEKELKTNQNHHEHVSEQNVYCMYILCNVWNHFN